jgi:hypothetical protein
MWLVPLRLYTDWVNSACLVRAARNLGGNILLTVFLSRELVRAAMPCSVTVERVLEV